MSEFDRFWRVFKDVTYFRISWKIQNIFLNSVDTHKKEKSKRSLNNNIQNIKDKVYNNKFTRSRIKK